MPFFASFATYTNKFPLRSENDHQVNLNAELEIRHHHKKFDVLIKQRWQKLLEIQRIQMDLMQELAYQRS